MGVDDDVVTATGESVKEIARRLVKPKYPWLIDPRKSRRIGYWDFMTSMALLFTATVTPYEVALLDPKMDMLFLINRIVDFIFLMDIPIQFITMTEKTSQSLTHGTQWVNAPWPIAYNYLTSWFTLDLFAISVSAFDVYAVGAQRVSDEDSDGAETSSLSNLTVLKTLRVLRLFKLMRLLRTSRITKRWETRVAIDYSMLSIFKCVMGVVIAAHWMACVWLLQAFIATPTPIPSWLGDDGYCVVNTTVPKGYTCQPEGTLYMASAYWSVMTLTSVGFGDVSATPFNVTEMAVCTVLMLISAFIYAQVIGTYCGVVSNMYPEQAAFRETLHDLNRFMGREGLPSEMCRRLREYFHQSKHLRLAETQRTILAQMPPSLKGEVAWKVNSTWLQKIWFLAEAPRAFMVELALSLIAMVYAPGDSPRIGYMYIVHRGVAIYNAKLVTKGRVFGEDMILSSPRLRSNAQAKAMNYLEVYYMSRRDLLFIAGRYPRTLSKIRRAAVMLALRRHIIQVAKEKIGVQAHEKIGETVKMLQLQEQAKKGDKASAQRLMKRQKTRTFLDAGAPVDVAEELPVDVEVDDLRTLSPGSISGTGSPLGMGMRMRSPSVVPGAGGGFGGGFSGGHGGGGGGGQEMLVDEIVQRVSESQFAAMAQLRQEMEEREARAQQQEANASKALEVASQTAARVDEILAQLKQLGKMRRQRRPAEGSPSYHLTHADGAEGGAEAAQPPPTVQGSGLRRTTMQSVTTVTTEDRIQDGVAEPMRRDRPRRRFSANPRSANPRPGTPPPAMLVGTLLEQGTALQQAAGCYISTPGCAATPAGYAATPTGCATTPAGCVAPMSTAAMTVDDPRLNA